MINTKFNIHIKNVKNIKFIIHIFKICNNIYFIKVIVLQLIL